MKNRKRSQIWGHAAEYCCITWLMLKGYSILARRYRNNFGEIDIIAKRGNTVAFIEVKARTDKAEALASITPMKQQRLVRAAEMYLASMQRFAHHRLRFDAMVITSPWNIHHLQDAWRAS